MFRLGKTVAFASLLYCAANASPVRAELIAYEGFDYNAGALAGSGAAGGGWSNAWQAGVTSSVVAGGLTYTDANGDQLAVSGNRALASGQTASAEPNRNLAVTRNTAGTTTWLSFIGQRLQPHATASDNLLRAANLQLRLAGNERLAIGKNSTNAITDPLGNWSIYNGATDVDYTTTSHLEQAFLVVRIDHVSGDVNDKAYLWVDPLLAAEPNIADAAEFPIAREFSFDQVRIFAGGNQAAAGATPARPYADFTYDEIRVGTDYSSVAPIVPEPTSATLIGAALIGGMFARSRRK